MHIKLPVGPRPRTRRAVLAAALALCALPAAAQAGVVDEAANGSLTYVAANGETNALLVTDANASSRSRTSRPA
jgi:hypothetical protein